MSDEPLEAEPVAEETTQPAATDDAATETSGGASASPEPYRPATVVDGIRQMLRGRGTGTKAQPASGTAADEAAVVFIDRRERLIASFLAAFQILLGFVVFFAYRKAVQKPSTKKPIITVAQAHADTLNFHHLAPELLVVNVLLGAFIAVSVLVKRRSLVGFTLLLGGLGMNASGGGVLGLIYLGFGIWLIFRALRRRQDARAGGAVPRGARAGRSGGRGSATTAKAAPQPERKPPAASKRYTPPRQRPKAAPPPPPTATQPEKESRLSAWLHR